MTTEDILFYGLVALCALGAVGGGGWFIHKEILRHAWHGSRAREELPGYQGFGLEHFEGDGRYGYWTGSVRGHEVWLKPDEQRKFHVTLRRRLGVRFSTDRGVEVPRDWTTFNTGNSMIDGFFHTRCARPDVAPRLSTAGAEQAAMTQFLNRWRGELSLLDISSQKIVATLELGSDWSGNHEQALTPDQIDALLPDLLDLCEALEEAGEEAA